MQQLPESGTRPTVLLSGKLKRAPRHGPSGRAPKNGGPADSVSSNPQIASVNVKPDTPMCWLHLSSKKTYALVDSGADISLISKETFDKIPRKHIRDFSTTDCIPLQSVSGHRLKSFGTATLQVSISGFDQPYKFQIVEGLKNQCILGTDFLTNFSAQLDFGHKTLNLGGYIIPLRPQKLACHSATSLIRLSQPVTVGAQSYVEIPANINREQLIGQDCLVQPLNNVPIFGDEPGFCLVTSVSKVSETRKIAVMIVNETGRDFTIPARSVIGIAEVLEDSDSCISSIGEQTQKSSETEDIPESQKVNLSHVSEAQRQKLQELLDKNNDLFAKNDCDLGRTHLVKAKIDTGDHSPIKQAPYRLPFSQRQMVQEHIDEMLKAGVISPSQSPWASPIVIVDKKDGSKRFCVDLRALNRITKKNSYPLPRIDDILASLDGSKYFTSLDLKSGYWQIAMDEESKEKTAFTCFAGLYSFNSMPFGCVNAPAIFSELMNEVLRGILHKFTVVYLDDILVYSKTFEEHIEHIEAVLSRLRNAGLKLKMSKCDFLKREVNYLGHVVSPNGIKPDPTKVEALQQLEPPTDVRGIRSFIGMTGYYRRFIPNYAKIAKPLTELTKKNRIFCWTEECQNSFETLRQALMEAPILAFPDISKPYKLYTDACGYAIGGVLVQETDMGERVIQYLSHQLNETQQRWPIIEKEAYAIVYCVQKFRPYLLGSKFTIMTDHKPLQHLFTSEMKNAKIQRWAILLDEYGGDVSYIRGSQNVVADALSRFGPGTATRESSSGPTDYVSLREEESEQRQCHVNSVHKPSVNVIDSDNAPEVQLETEVSCEGEDQGEKKNKEKFSEFLKNHPDFQTIQAEDVDSQRILKILEDPNHPNHADISKHYVLEEGLLYRVSEHSKCGRFVGLQLVIPEFLQKPLVEEIHAGYFGGHLGVDKTYDRLRSRYYWPGMYRDVVVLLQNCAACNMRKLRRERPPLQKMQIPKYPFEQIAIDTCGPFPESYNGNRYIINVIDLFSGWPESFATKNKSAETVAQILMEHIIPRHACPRIIVSDNGTEFCNAVIDQIAAFFNIKHIRTSVYHPQANGKCERYNRVQNDMLAKLVDRTHRNWDSKIPSILSAYRTAKNETTKFSPFFVLYGRDPVLPVDTLLSPKYRYHGEEYVPSMLESMCNTHHHVQHNLENSHEKNKVYYDRKAKPVNINVGDMVYFRDPSETATSKLSSSWKPFYRVLKALSDVTFVIKNQLTGHTKVVNAYNLRRANSENVWKNLTDHPSHIDSKYQEKQAKQKSQIPIRVQPSRRAKLSAGPELYEYSEPLDDIEPPQVSDMDDQPTDGPDDKEKSDDSQTDQITDQTVDQQSDQPTETADKPTDERPDDTIIENPSELPDLPKGDTDSSDDDLPLADLQRRWKRQNVSDSDSEDNLPLSKIAKHLPTNKETTSESVKRPLDRDQSPPSGTETKTPAVKYSRHGLSDIESDFSEPEAVDDEVEGACKSVNVTNPSKAVLFAKLMELFEKL